MAGLSNRQTEILNIARASGRVIVEDLARRFEVSAQTIRKDLNDLCDQRSLTRIHGGAIIASGVENLAYEARRFVAAEEKRAIGIAAASRIPNGCSLFINIGTAIRNGGGDRYQHARVVDCQRWVGGAGHHPQVSRPGGAAVGRAAYP